MRLVSHAAIMALLASWAWSSSATALSGGTSEAIYFLDNDPAGASIVAHEVSADGQLSNPVRTLTGGAGQFAVNGTGFPAATDTTHSQGIVAVSGDRLFTVNPGSNTLSLFQISPDSPTHLSLIGSPISTLGNFPNSLAISPSLNLVCTVNTGGPKAGISCFSYSKPPPGSSSSSTAGSGTGLVPSGQFIPLSLVNQTTTPPTGPQDTTSQILFNPSSTALFVTLKSGDGMSPGAVYAFPVIKTPSGKRIIASKGVVSRPAGLVTDFSMTFVGKDDTRAVITDPAYGASLVRIDYPSLEVSVLERVVIPGQRATCWSVFSPDFPLLSSSAQLLDGQGQEQQGNKENGMMLTLDGGNPNVTVIDTTTGMIKQTLAGPRADKVPGHLDSAIGGRYLFALQAAPGISVFDLGNRNGAVLKRSVDLSGLGRNQGWQGLAVYPCL